MTVRVAPTGDLAAALAIRRRVFIEEQGVSEADDLDGRDGEALHFLATDDGLPVGTARVLFSEGTGKIGRVAVLPSHRGTGLGKALVLAAVEEIRRLGGARAKLGAQIHAIAFYEALGFAAAGPDYIDAGIPHRDMVREL